MNRCKFVNLNNPLYIAYHDNEWSKNNKSEHDLFELLILECFQAGLSWECVLNKRAAFRQAYDNFDINKIIKYNNKKIESLLNNKNIIRNKLKIKASIQNSKIFKQIQTEFKSFATYLKTFCPHQIIEDYSCQTTSQLSDTISADLKKRGMSFVGSTIIYSYLQAIGLINAHGKECDLCLNKKN